MVAALAVYYYLRRGRPSLGAEPLRHGLGGPDGCLRRPGPAARARPTHGRRPASVAAVERRGRTCSRPRTRAWPPPWPPRCSSCPASSTTPTARRPCWGRSSRLIPRQLWEGKPAPADQEILALVWGGTPCGYQGQCSTFSPFGEPYRDGGLVGVFLFALLFGVFWKVAWLYYLRHRDSTVAIVAYASAAAVHDQLDAGELHAPGLAGSHGPGGHRPRGGALSHATGGTSATSRDHDPVMAARRRPRPGSGGPTCSSSARRRPGPRPCTTSSPDTRRSTCRR